jgi:octaprenyl-diphosphate synthase
VPQLAELYAPIALDLERSQRLFRDELISDQGFVSDMCAHVAQFHGKRLRPALLLLSARACRNVKPAHHVLAAVVEMVHIATLVHDDVLDDADIRRRAATVNRLWGTERAVLMGDFLISHAFHLCSTLGATEAARLIGEVTNTTCEGEMMQVASRYNFDLSADEYLDIITRKTAALIGVCCLLGARFAEAPAAVVAALREYGVCLGIAFQITDDVLDLVGDEAEAGKSLGRDLAGGKLTLPVIHALDTAPAGQRVRLRAMLDVEGAPEQREIVRLLHTLGSVEYARQAAAEHVRRARAALGLLPESEARAALATLADFVLDRQK